MIYMNNFQIIIDILKIVCKKLRYMGSKVHFHHLICNLYDDCSFHCLASTRDATYICRESTFDSEDKLPSTVFHYLYWRAGLTFTYYLLSIWSYCTCVRDSMTRWDFFRWITICRRLWMHNDHFYLPPGASRVRWCWNVAVRFSSMELLYVERLWMHNDHVFLPLRAWRWECHPEYATSSQVSAAEKSLAPSLIHVSTLSRKVSVPSIVDAPEVAPLSEEKHVWGCCRISYVFVSPAFFEIECVPW